MKVIRFPRHGGSAKFTEDEVTNFDTKATPGAGNRPYQPASAGDYPDYDINRPPPRLNEKLVRSPNQNTRPSPADVIANAVTPGICVRRTTDMRRARPADIIAQTLNPPRPDAIQELLRQSFWNVWLQHRDYLKRKGSLFLDHRREDAEDALSATMLKALNNFVESAGAINNARAWLTTILHNACMDGHRSAKRSKDMFTEAQASHLENLASDNGSQAQTPEDIVRIRESLEDLYHRIRELPQVLREPLLLRTVEHLSYAEIAQRLALTEVNVRKRVQQARGRLRAARGHDSLSGDTPKEF